jgi:hypothetical protein
LPKIDPLMAAFNAIALMAASLRKPAVWTPSDGMFVHAALSVAFQVVRFW